MKATGIVRCIDDLGRVVIPKEIRRTMKIREGDPLEIYLDNDCVCFRKYSMLGNIKEDGRRATEALNGCGIPCALYDNSGIFVSGMNRYNVYAPLLTEDESRSFRWLDRENKIATLPIVVTGEICGYLIFRNDEDGVVNQVRPVIKMLALALS